MSGEPPLPGRHSGPGPHPYQYPYQYPYPPPRPTNNMAVASMVVSVASFVSCPLIGAVGAYLGYRARKEIAASGEEGGGMATAGIIAGWVAIGFAVLLALFMIAWFGLFFGLLGLGTASSVAGGVPA